MLQLGGAQALTGPELAAALSRALSKPLRYAPFPLVDLEAGLNQLFGPPAGTELAQYYAWLAEPRERSLLDVDTARARAELSVPQQSFEQWARDVPWADLAGAGK